MAAISTDKQNKEIKIILKSNDHKIIDMSVQSVIESAKRTGATVTGPIPLKTKVFKLTVLRSPIRHTKAREQYKQCVHKRVMFINVSNSKTLDALKELVLPDGIDISLEQS